MQHDEKKVFIRGFRSEECIQCGICLAQCQYSDLTSQEARHILKEISVSPVWNNALSSCIRCGKCDYRCPKNARPGDLMRECLECKRQESSIIPSSMAYGINGMAAEGWKSSFFQDVFRGLGKKDKKILDTWSTPKKSKDILWIGCTDRMLPRTLENACALRNIAKFGGPDDCCGAWAIQGGLIDEGYRIARRLVSRLEECSFDRLVVLCGHCQKILTKSFPDKLGLELPFPIISVYDYFLEILENGTVNVKSPLNIDVAISDPCFASENGDPYMSNIRKLAGKIGMNITEMPRNQENSICCGYGGLYTDGKVSNVIKSSKIKRKDMAACGKKHVLSYCPGCHLINHYFQIGYKSHYLLEDVLSALGETQESPYSIFYRRLIRPHIAWRLAGVSKSAFL